jgi:hypothetical protein
MDIKEIIFDLIDDHAKGVDTYNHNGSTWLIFTDSKKWVIELTKEKTLWYNYYFFNNIFKYLSLDVIENQNYITEWVENTIQNGVKDTSFLFFSSLTPVENTIQNGVKHTQGSIFDNPTTVKDTIQNGVKHTYSDKIPHEYDWTDQFTEEIDDIIQNGVIDTAPDRASYRTKVESIVQNGVKVIKSVSNNMVDALKTEGKIVYADDYTQDFWVDTVVEKGIIKETKDALSTRLPGLINIIDNGVKLTNKSLRDDESCVIDEVVENGIKETKQEPSQRTWMSEQVVENGIKETKKGGFNQHFDMFAAIEKGVKETNPHFLEIINPINFEPVIQEMKRLNEVNDTIQNGVKEVKELPDQSGELRGYGDYYRRQDDMTKPHTLYVNDVINGGIKETVTGSDKRMLVENVLNNGVKLT